MTFLKLSLVKRVNHGECAKGIVINYTWVWNNLNACNVLAKKCITNMLVCLCWNIQHFFNSHNFLCRDLFFVDGQRYEKITT